jgi:hypothetical protein
MNLAEAGSLASIGSFILAAILALVKFWPDIIRRGGSMISRAILVLLIIGILSAGFSLYAAWYIKPSISEIPAIGQKETKDKSEEMIAFAYEEIKVPPDKAVGLGAIKLKVMEASPFSYSVRIMVEDAAIAFLETGDTPTSDTKQIIYPDSTLTMKSISEMNNFKAIGIKGTATLAVTYYRGYKTAEKMPTKAEQRQANSSYYLIGKNGDILKIDGLDQYDLNIKKDNMLIMKGKSGDKVPTYILSFKKAPNYVDVTNQEGATTNVKQITPYEYNVQFYSPGWGIPGVECDFRIQVY